MASVCMGVFMRGSVLGMGVVVPLCKGGRTERNSAPLPISIKVCRRKIIICFFSIPVEQAMVARDAQL